MTNRQPRLPGPDHPITIVPNPNRVIVRVGSDIIADTCASVTLREAAYPAVHYIPRQDVRFDLLERSDHSTYCPYKGECSYYSVPAGGAKSVNAVWSYENPYPSVAAIQNHMAFYPDRVGSLSESTNEAAASN